MSRWREAIWYLVAVLPVVGATMIFVTEALPPAASQLALLSSCIATSVALGLLLGRGLLPRIVGFTVAIAVMPIAVLGLLNDHAARGALIERGDSLLRGAAERTALAVESFLTVALDGVRTDAQNPLFGRYLAALEAATKDEALEQDALSILRSYAMRDPIFVSSVELVDRRGVVVADTDPSRPAPSLAGEGGIRDLLERGVPDFVVVNPVAGSGTPGLVVAAPVRGPRVAVVGGLFVRYDLAALQCVVAHDAGSLGAGSFSILVDTDGRILAHSGDPRLVRASAQDWSEFHALANSPGHVASVRAPAAVDRIAALRCASEAVGSRGWKVVFAQAPESYLAPIDSQSRQQILLVLVASACAFVISLSLARRLMLPIRRLSTAAERFSAGDLDARVTIDSSDELGVLGSTFNKMASELKNSLGGLRTEIRERERVEAELRGNEERFRALIENSLDMILVLEAGGAIRYATPTAVRGLGRSESELVGSRFADFVADSDRESVARFVAARHDRDETPLAFEIETPHRGARLVEALGRDASDVPGVRGVIVTLRDITDRRILERQLAQAQKMEGIGLLAGGIAHDFNNLMVPIFGYGEIARDALAPDDPTRESLDKVLAAAESAKKLVQQLLAFGRKQTLTFKGIDLVEAVRDTESLLRRTLRDDVVLKVRSGTAPLIVEADVTQVRQVLVNLVLNAEDAMPTGGDLEIEVRKAVASDAQFGRGDPVAPVAHVVVFVRDSGEGMDLATQARIFEPFFTTKGVGKGTGLGLATAYGIIRQHRGAIRFTSEPGKGTTFAVFLPRSSRLEQSQPKVRAEPPSRVGGTILLVEDDERVRELVVHVLSSNGYVVFAARSADEAIAKFTEFGSSIDLLLTDVVMPHVNGRALYERLRARQPGLRVLYMSGYTGDIITRNGILEVGTPLLAKPFTTNELLQRVAEEIAGSRIGPAAEVGDAPGSAAERAGE
jgi:PAS domain S-box-containing protein